MPLEKPYQEEKESYPSESKVITKEELKELIYKGEHLPQDSRFLSPEEGGVFKYFHVSDLVNNRIKKELVYPVVTVNDIIVALIELEKSPYQKNVYWIKFISVDPAFQGYGYASKVAEEAFKYAQQKGIALQSSSYTEEGFIKIKPKLNEFAKKYSVNFIDVS